MKAKIIMIIALCYSQLTYADLAPDLKQYRYELLNSEVFPYEEELLKESVEFSLQLQTNLCPQQSQVLDHFDILSWKAGRYYNTTSYDLNIYYYCSVLL